MLIAGGRQRHQNRRTPAAAISLDRAHPARLTTSGLRECRRQSSRKAWISPGDAGLPKTRGELLERPRLPV